jgi:hypothetical protein
MDENLSTGGPILIPSCLQLNASVYKVKREDGHGDLSFSESPLSVPVSHVRYRLTMKCSVISLALCYGRDTKAMSPLIVLLLYQYVVI